MYSLDHTLLFDPLDLDLDVTPDNIRACIIQKEYLKALVVCPLTTYLSPAQLFIELLYFCISLSFFFEVN